MAFVQIQDVNLLHIPLKTKIITKDIVSNLLNEQGKSVDDIYEVVFNTDLEEIGNNAFEEFPSLLRIIIPNSVKIVGENAFYKSKTIEYISFGENVTEIKKGAFFNMGKGKLGSDYKVTVHDKYQPQIILGKSIQKIHEQSFYNLSKLDLLCIPDTQTIDTIHFNWLRWIRVLIRPRHISVRNTSFKTHKYNIRNIRIMNEYNDVEKIAFLNTYNFTNFVFPKMIIYSNSELKNLIFKDADMRNITIKNKETGNTSNVDDYLKVFKDIDFARHTPKYFPKVISNYYKRYFPRAMSKIGISSDVAEHHIMKYLNNNSAAKVRFASSNHLIKPNTLMKPLSNNNNNNKNNNKEKKNNTENAKTKNNKNKTSKNNNNKSSSSSVRRSTRKRKVVKYT